MKYLENEYQREKACLHQCHQAKYDNDNNHQGETKSREDVSASK